MRAPTRAAQPATIRASQGDHFQHREQVLHERPFADAAHVHAGQQRDHAAGHHLGRIQFPVQQAVGQVRLDGRGQQLAQRDPRQHGRLAEARHQRPEVLGKGDRHGGIEAASE